MASGSSESARDAASASEAASQDGATPKAPDDRGAQVATTSESTPSNAKSDARHATAQDSLPRGPCRLTLDIADAQGVERRAVFDPMESLLVGSGASASLRIGDPSVAKVHCLLKLEGGELSAIDLGSDRGTRVNGTPLSGARVIRRGSLLTVGEVTLRVVAIEASHNGARHRPRPPVLEVRLLWKGDLLEVAQRQRGVMRVGSDTGCDLRCFVPECPKSAPLAQIKDGVATLLLPQGARVAGSMPATGDGLTDARSPTSLTLRRCESARVEWGDFSLEAEMKEAAPRPRRDKARLDPLAPIFLVLFAALAAILWRVHESSVDEAAWADDFFADRQKIERWVIAVQPPKPPAPPESQQATADDSVQPEKPKAPRPPGRAGRPGDKGQRAKDRVMRAGLLGVLGGKGGLGLSGVLGGGGGLGAGVDKALGELKGGATGQTGAGGLGGLGLRGMAGRGGGLGIGGLGTGMGGGGGDGGQGGGGGLGRKKTLQRRVIPGKSVLAGSCEREVIGKVIGKNARQVLACYEAELTRTPELAGKLSVRFTIEPNGRVGDLQITESTMASPSIERCVSSRIKRWRFPEPKGGGLCVVNYPWVFQQAGEGG